MLLSLRALSLNQRLLKSAAKHFYSGFTKRALPPASFSVARIAQRSASIVINWRITRWLWVIPVANTIVPVTISATGTRRSERWNRLQGQDDWRNVCRRLEKLSFGEAMLSHDIYPDLTVLVVCEATSNPSSRNFPIVFATSDAADIVGMLNSTASR